MQKNRKEILPLASTDSSQANLKSYAVGDVVKLEFEDADGTVTVWNATLKKQTSKTTWNVEYRWAHTLQLCVRCTVYCVLCTVCCVPCAVCRVLDAVCFIYAD